MHPRPLEATTVPPGSELQIASLLTNHFRHS